MHQRDVVTRPGQCRSDLNAEHPTAQHYSWPRVLLNRADIGQRTKGEDMRSVTARNGRYKRRRPGGKDQFVPGQRGCCGTDLAFLNIHGEHLFAPSYRHTPCVIPGVILQADLLRLFFPAQYRREHDAVVSVFRLLAKHGDREATRRTLGQRGNQPCCGHPITDNDQSHHRLRYAALGCFS